MPAALITGITGQDGSYLADLLLGKGYRVVGVVRSDANTARIDHILDRLELVSADLVDQRQLVALLEKHRPDEIYNLGARASSTQLFDDPVLTAEVNGLAVLRFLEAIRSVNPAIRFCQASSSEMFGNALTSPQDENTVFRPRNPYGIAKLFGHWSTVNHRQVHGLFACSAILFNHESPRRGLEFVTRKISRSVARIHAGLDSQLQLGDLEARRDWGFAGDYVNAMWLMLQAPVADDYVLATGESHSVREFCEVAFGRVGLDYRKFVVQNVQGQRRAPEHVPLSGNPSKARGVLGWTPQVTFNGLVSMMVDSDVEALRAAAA